MIFFYKESKGGLEQVHFFLQSGLGGVGWAGVSEFFTMNPNLK